jgi:MEMO1 family protein
MFGRMDADATAPPGAGNREGLTRLRKPGFAGLFYPADPKQCAAMAKSYVRPRERRGESKWLGAVVPHAGWVCSGDVAGESIAAIRDSFGETLDVVVVFAAIHTPVGATLAVLDDFAGWETPGAVNSVAEELRTRVGEDRNWFVTDDQFHEHEHAVEVELPLIEQAWPGVLVLPVEVPLVQSAAQIGVATARRVAGLKLRAVFLASSDLTHYGPAYRNTPGGVGHAGLDWARDNDRRLLERIEALDVDGIVPHVVAHQNACGGGAIAAMLAACRELGASTARVLRQTNSFEALQGVEDAPQQPDNAVGYASVVVG